jgi:hypothetical protein
LGKTTSLDGRKVLLSVPAIAGGEYRQPGPSIGGHGPGPSFHAGNTDQRLFKNPGNRPRYVFFRDPAVSSPSTEDSFSAEPKPILIASSINGSSERAANNPSVREKRAGNAGDNLIMSSEATIHAVFNNV